MEPTITVYRDGRRVAEALPLDKSAIECHDPATLSGSTARTERRRDRLAEDEFDLHPLAVEDAVNARQRPKIDHYEGFFALVAYGVSVE